MAPLRLTLPKQTEGRDVLGVFKNPVNKRQFKKIFVDHIMQICGSHMKNNQCIYFNGTFEEVKVWRAKKFESGYTKLEVVENHSIA